MIDRRTLISRIRKLLAFTPDNTTQGEFNAATEKVWALLVAYNMTMDEVLGTGEIAAEELPDDATQTNTYKWQLLLGLAVSRLVGIEAIQTRGHIRFVGTRDDIEVTRTIYEELSTQIKLTGARYILLRPGVQDLPAGKRRRILLSFQLGIVSAIYERVKYVLHCVPLEQRKREAQKQAIQHWVKDNGIGNKKVSRSAIASPKAFSTGQNIGQHIDLMKEKI